MRVPKAVVHPHQRYHIDAPGIDVFDACARKAYIHVLWNLTGIIILVNNSCVGLIAVVSDDILNQIVVGIIHKISQCERTVENRFYFVYFIVGIGDK